MKRTRVVAALVAFALGAAACGSTNDQTTTTTPGATGAPGTTTSPTTSAPEGFTPGELLKLDLPRSTAAVTDADIAAVVAADREFGFDLFGVVAGDENTMVSPYSIATALSMLYPGARGTTAGEIADVLHLTVDDATLHAARNHIETALAMSPPLKDDGDTRESFTIRPVNSAWGQGGYAFLDEYLEVLAENYGAGMSLLDYVGDPEGSRATINDWVEEATEDRIVDLIPPGAITGDTRLALVNAIWFKANWFEPFDSSDTASGSFTLLEGGAVDVSLMHAGLRTGYAATDQYEAVRLPYAGNAAMVVLLPRSGSPADLAQALGPDHPEIAWSEFYVDVTLPRFEFDTEVGLKAALQDLGMRAVFEPPIGEGADLTGITAARELFVTDAFHKTFIALDEEGTEAAAATALIVGLTSLPEPATFTADRPFLFWIEHTSTGEMLFLGQVTDPS